MMEKIKLIWDFRGPNAEPIAQHHAKHLEEYARNESLGDTQCGVEMLTPMHHIAFLIVEKHHLETLRERLKPNRGRSIPT
jgi:hypothetical protein